MGGAISAPNLDEDLLNSIRQLRQASNGADRRLLGRNEEMGQLINLLAGEPSRVTLLVGPKDSGKSKLLLHLKEIWQGGDSEIRQILAPCILINLRECLHIDVREDSYAPAGGLVRGIRQEVMAWHDMAMEVVQSGGDCSIAPNRQSIASTLARFSKDLGHQLVSILSTFQTFLKGNPHVRPVIIIDEANVLKSWCHYWKLKEEVERLAHFFLWLTKETGKGHVVMASSAGFFWSWLSETLEFADLKCIPVGHFSEHDAKNFFVNHGGLASAGDLNADIWKSVYQVTGGSPHLLKIVASEAIELGSWADALASMVSSRVEELRERLLGTDHYWSFAHLEGIVGAIVDGGGLASLDDVITHVFSGDESKGRHLVAQLVEKNIVHVRLWNRGMKYKDCAEKRGDSTIYLMATNPPSLVAMRQLYPAWFATKTQLDAATKQENTRQGRGEHSGDVDEDWDYE